MSEDIDTHHHHHHHHHHHSSSGGSSGTSSTQHRHSPSSDYSLRSFGKKVEEEPLPEGTLPVAIFSAFITALVLGTIVIALLYRNKSLKDEVYALRTQLGTLMEQSGMDGLDPNAPRIKTSRPRHVGTGTNPKGDSEGGVRVVTVVKSADAVRAALDEEDDEEDDGEAYEEAREGVTRRVAAEPAPEPVRVLSDEEIAKAVNMSLEEIAALKRDIALEPNGFRQETDEEGNVTFLPDPFAQNLQGAFDLLALGQNRDAAAIFGLLSTAKPLWPYGHFYKAIAEKDKNELTRANLLFSTVRALGRQTAESELYSALTALFLKENSAAASTLLRIPAMTADRPELQIGPVLVPKSTPLETMKRLKAIQGVKVVKEIDW